MATADTKVHGLDVNPKATTSPIAFVGESTHAFDIVDRILTRHSASVIHISEKRLLYMLAEMRSGLLPATPAPELFLFNLLGPFRYDWRDTAKRLRDANPNVAIVVLAGAPTAAVISDSMRVGADELLYETELSFPDLVWQRIGGLIEVAQPAATSPMPPNDRVSPPSSTTVLSILAPDLRAPSGRLDATKIAKRLGVPIARLAGVVGVSRQALSQTPDSPGIQQALERIAQTLHVLDNSLHPDDQRKWLRTSRESLDHNTPLDSIMSGRADVVARIMESL